METIAQLAHVAHMAIHTKVGSGIITGVAAAAMADYANFRTWKCWHDVAVYDWGTATWRWVQGAVVGLITALGLSAV